ncbi:acetate/propionate family kinase [Rhodoligotrophos defluvii]|uniref:acetate/propionate family kinase n=1 Tax=Rhodoligotrophos defluvii TaxID=2561934 RepID=UPI0010CA077C|nr:acetate/propionate family kinase [Rhodoligotrophos defluvii]
MAGSDLVLTVNPGSSTIKFAGFSARPSGAPALFRAKIDFARQPLQLDVNSAKEHEAHTVQRGSPDDLAGIMAEVLDICAQLAGESRITAVGHRVVHGGNRFAGPVRVTSDTLAQIEALVPLAPLHQPQSVALIKATASTRPDLPQVACFDTAFHHTQRPEVRRLAIPRQLYEEGVQRYGFHGLSYAYIAHRLREVAPEIAKGRVVVAHLGSGASLCGMKDGVSIDTTMGFSTLDGIPMSTRCGALDPGVILYLLQQRGCSPAQAEEMLYHHCGLLGVSGISGDTRLLIEKAREHGGEAERAREALDLFCFHIARQTAALANSLGGLDALVFTAGIGENQPEIRALACRHLGWLGVKIDEAANRQNAMRIDTTRKGVAILVLPTDEEWMIAEEIRGPLGWH